ncbi:MAG: hypothetical protein ACE5KK_06855 [Candidatus Brocadiales bacterium]
MKFSINTLSDMVDTNPSLKAVIDMVAYKVSQNQENKGPDANLVTAEAAVWEYISDHFKNLDDFLAKLSPISGDTKELQEIAENIYRYQYRRRELTFEMVKDRISKHEDIALKTITDLVAYRIYKSPEDKGAEVNFITAETFVSHYVSESFASMEDFDRRLQELGYGIGALRSFADNIYKYYCEHRTH